MIKWAIYVLVLLAAALVMCFVLKKRCSRRLWFVLWAVLLLAAVIAACSMIRIEEKPVSFAKWAGSMTGESIQWAEISKNHENEEAVYTVPQNEFGELSDLFSTLTGDMYASQYPDSAKNGYRLSLYREDILWVFYCLEDGKVSLSADGSQTGEEASGEGQLLLINSPALWEYIVHTADEKGVSGETAIAADYAPEDLRGSGSAYECVLEDSEYSTEVLLTARRTVKDFKILALNMNETDENGNIRPGSVEVLYSLEELSPEKPLVLVTGFAGVIPSVGISYADSNGEEKMYAVSMSGKDGSLFLMEIDGVGNE